MDRVEFEPTTSASFEDRPILSKERLGKENNNNNK